MKPIKYLLSSTLIIASLNAKAGDYTPTSALEYQQTTNTRIVVEENFLRFFTGASERMTIDGSGNVGIGMTSPSSPLHVKSSINRTIKLDFTGIGAGGSYTWQSLLANSTEQWRIVGRDNNNANLEFWNNASEPVLSLIQNGNVGIGTTNPGSYKLNVDGNTFVNGSITFPTVAYNGTTSATHLSFPVATDGFYIMTQQTAADKMDVLFRLRDNNTGDYFKLWFDDYRGTAYDRYPLIVYGNGVHLVSDGGNVGIGTVSPGYKLHVNGDAYASTFITDANTYADFVFDDDYQLAPLSEVEEYIQENNHLPDMPSEAEAKANGVDLQEMQAKLLQKIEELTLYVIELKKENKDQQQRIKKLESQRQTANGQ